jgi:transcriptional regulator with XRE-family HTH domain
MSRINFGYILRGLRHGREETLEQVSEATGLSVAMLSRVERGERLPSPESVEALAKHFEIPVDYLMSETIANRMVNRYGEEKSSRAAEHMSREPRELDLMRDPNDEDDEAVSDAQRSGARSSPASRRSYGPFQERDILAALGSLGEAQRRSRADQERPAAAQAPPAADATAAAQAPPAERRVVESLVMPSARLLSRSKAKPGDALGEDPGEDIDPATEQVLRAAGQASEAAALLVRREAPSLSREARLALIDRITALAGQAMDVLHMLAADPDRSVRGKAIGALKRLNRT